MVSPVSVGCSFFARIFILPWQGKVCFCSPFPLVSSCIDCFDFTHNPGLLWAPVGRAVMVIRNKFSDHIQKGREIPARSFTISTECVLAAGCLSDPAAVCARPAGAVSAGG